MHRNIFFDPTTGLFLRFRPIRIESPASTPFHAHRQPGMPPLRQADRAEDGASASSSTVSAPTIDVNDLHVRICWLIVHRRQAATNACVGVRASFGGLAARQGEHGCGERGYVHCTASKVARGLHQGACGGACWLGSHAMCAAGSRQGVRIQCARHPLHAKDHVRFLGEPGAFIHHGQCLFARRSSYRGDARRDSPDALGPTLPG